MRLDPATIPALLRAVRERFGDEAEVWLFGSRADDCQRGGDIDLYIETDVEQGIVARRSDLRRELEAVFGEQKIDIAVRPRSRPPHPLHEIARERGVLLRDGA
ncbi:nucleotidyltransferase domain-containing protein [Thiohalocapsa sp. ML1]|uniref:nucleotidyltransferase domain-containing protein n=1 Tax=Thiohalocapsa sp. ML1 TaxID=1431688 RepID=UPI0007321591|nr:nucleotidyltransferase domain-containing protein [Thiohalocapsa sp. ML1]